MHTTTLSTHGPSGSVHQALRRATQSIFGAVVTYLRRKRACAALMRMDDRQLRDIGINRSEIPNAVYGRRDGGPVALRWIAVDKRHAVLR